MASPEYDTRFSNVEDIKELVDPVSSYGAFAFPTRERQSLDPDADLRTEFSTFEAASDEDFRRFERMLD